MSEVVLKSLDAGVLRLTLNRPEKKNAITQAMYQALAEAMEEAARDSAVRAVLFLGAGDSFCAGNDIGDFIAIASGGTAPAEMSVFRFLKAMAEFDKPVVAGVRGRAVGIGVTLLLHCDMVVVADDALLSVPFVNLALAPEAASSILLPAVIGHQRAFEMIALGEPITGDHAFAWGLANRAVASGDVEAVAQRLAEALASRAPGSLRATKRLMRDAAALWAKMQSEGEAFGAQMLSAEAMEAFTAFAQKRAPDFSRS